MAVARATGEYVTKLTTQTHDRAGGRRAIASGTTDDQLGADEKADWARSDAVSVPKRRSFLIIMRRLWLMPKSTALIASPSAPLSQFLSKMV
jgi:hypothetical protein